MSMDFVMTHQRNGRPVERYRFHGRLARRIKIGRMANADIRLDDPAASRLHATIELKADRALLHDLGTLTGVELNGELLRAGRAELYADDEVRIGDTLLRVTWETEELAVPLPPLPPAAAVEPDATEICLTEVVTGSAAAVLAAASPAVPIKVGPPAGPREALLRRLAGVSDGTAIELESALERVRATRRPPSPSEGEYYDTHRLVHRMRREHHRGRAAVAVIAAGMAILFIAPLVLGNRPPSGRDSPGATAPAPTSRLPANATAPERTHESAPVAQPSTVATGLTPEERSAHAALTHRVRRGETLGSIAERYYGSAMRWRLLHRANLQAVSDPTQLEVGTLLQIPSAER